MFMVDATATGEENVLTKKSSDLLFRKQLENYRKRSLILRILVQVFQLPI